MEPISETTEAIDEFGPFLESGDLLEELRVMAGRVEVIVPDSIGLSVAYREHGVTFTLVASEEVISALEGLQYLDDGPCLNSVEHEQVQQFAVADMLAEGRWQVFARGSVAAGVASTLTLPIVVADAVVGSVNLYAASSAAFDGHHEELAEIFGAWAPGAVANADLAFETRRTAQKAPRILLDDMRIQVAVGILVASLNLTVAAARAHLRESAVRAGVSETAVAKVVIAQATYPQTPGDD